ncbi:hypothetical protein G4228_004796 [Cervus hanglu yarkandensis]|nr:hypothetical protein G4228_004796 [Cervus hanglu yarkandensis]
MSSKANASKKKSQQLKRNPKRKIDEEAEISENKEETDKMVATIESMTGDIHSLKNKVHVLTSEVEEEEKKIKQMFQIDSGVLSLPELSQKSLRAPILQVYGAVMNINRGNPFQKEVVLDSWPDFKAIITRRQKEAATDNLDHYTNAYAVFYKDVNAYRQLLEEHGVINWDQVFQIQGLQSELYDVSKAIADSKQVDVKLASFKAVCLSTVSTADTSSLYVNQVSPSGGALMLWMYKLQYPEYLIPLRNILECWI